jgi:hypothetical protein
MHGDGGGDGGNSTNVSPSCPRTLRARACTHHYYVLDGHAVVRRDRSCQLVALWLAVHPHPRGALAHGRHGTRRRAEAALVGAEARAERASAASLLRLRSDERDSGGQAADQGGEPRRTVLLRLRRCCDRTRRRRRRHRHRPPLVTHRPPSSQQATRGSQRTAYERASRGGQAAMGPTPTSPGPAKSEGQGEYKSYPGQTSSRTRDWLALRCSSSQQQRYSLLAVKNGGYSMYKSSILSSGFSPFTPRPLQLE